MSQKYSRLHNFANVAERKSLTASYGEGSLSDSASPPRVHSSLFTSSPYRKQDDIAVRRHQSLPDITEGKRVVSSTPLLHTKYYFSHESRLHSSRGAGSRRRTGSFNSLSSSTTSDEDAPLIATPRLPWNDPEGPIYSFFVLFWCCICYMGSYYIYDSIGTVEKPLEQFFNINAGKFGMLYSVYSLPNIIIPFFGGILLERLGVRFGLFACSFLIMLGSFVVVVSTFAKSFPLALVGRFIFGLGAETSYVALDTIIVTWFSSGPVGMAMGISVSAGRLGTWLTFNINPWAAHETGTWKVALWISAAMGVAGFIAACMFCVLDKYAEVVKNRRKRLSMKINDDEELEAPEPVNLKVITTFPFTFWLICILVTLYYAVVFPFESTATSLLSTRYNYSPVNAGRIISLLPMVSMILSPIFGLFVDKIGRRPFLVLMGEILMTGAIMFMAVTYYNPIPSVVAIGLVFALVPAALWPCLPIVVSGNFATAFGIMTTIMNIGLFLTYYLQGYVNDVFHNNSQYALFFYAALAGGGILLSALWVVLDIKHGGKCSQKSAPAPVH